MSQLARLALFAPLLALPAYAQITDVEFAQNLVRAQYFEGLPYARARQLTPAGVSILLEMLEDPAEAAYRVNIVMALGISGARSTYPALTRFYERPAQGEIHAAEYRARRAVPIALGHLAHHDPRALEYLFRAVRAKSTRSPPSWRYGQIAGRRLEDVLWRASVTGTAVSGRPQAAAFLRKLGEAARADPGASEQRHLHIREAQEFCDRVMREGPDRIFAAGGSP